jgi:hypothetical protein
MTASLNSHFETPAIFAAGTIRAGLSRAVIWAARTLEAFGRKRHRSFRQCPTQTVDEIRVARLVKAATIRPVKEAAE